MDNVMVERLWRSLEYKCVYLHAYERDSKTRLGIYRGLAATIPAIPTPVWMTPDEAYAEASLPGPENAPIMSPSRLAV